MSVSIPEQQGRRELEEVSISEQQERRALQEFMKMGAGPNQYHFYKAEEFRLYQSALGSLAEKGLVEEMNQGDGHFRVHGLTLKGKEVYQGMLGEYRADEVVVDKSPEMNLDGLLDEGVRLRAHQQTALGALRTVSENQRDGQNDLPTTYQILHDNVRDIESKMGRYPSEQTPGDIYNAVVESIGIYDLSDDGHFCDYLEKKIVEE